MNKKNYKIGVSAPLSGCETKHGEAMVRSVELAIEEANQNNPGLQFEAVICDDKGDTAAGKDVAKELIADPLVMGVVGPLNSNPSAGAAPLYNEAGLVQIASAASNVALSQQGYRTFFRVVANDDVQADALVDFMKNYLKTSTITVINDSTDFSSGLASIVAERAAKAGIKVLDHLQVPFGQDDYQAELSGLDIATPEVIFFAILEPEGKLITKHLREKGNRSIFLGTDALKPSKFLLTPGYDVPGPYHSCATTDIATAPSAAGFARAYQSKYGELYSVYTAEAYDAAGLLIQAIGKCPVPSREAVLEQVKKTKDYQGASGKIAFTETGELVEPKISFHYYKNETLQFLGFSDQYK